MASKTKQLQQAWKNWQKNPSDAQKSHLLKKAQPRIEKAILSYAGQKGLSDPVIRLKAETLATKAFQKYDPEKAKLSTYLHTQLQPLRRTVHERAQDLSIPPTVWADLQNMKKGQQEFLDDEGKDPSTSELADRTGLSMRRIETLRKFSDAGIPEGALRKHNPQIVQSFTGKNGENVGLWARAVYDSLGPEDQKIFEWRTGSFGKNKISNKQIARKLGISAAAVSQRAKKIAEMIERGLE